MAEGSPLFPGGSPLPAEALVQAGAVVARQLGLHFPPERRGDLERGLLAAARQLGHRDAAAWVSGLAVSGMAPREVQVLASHLTVGETYFFRDRHSFAVLEQHVLPALVEARRGTSRRLCIWSAGCCTGEEVYSLAILLHQLLPDLPDWRLTLLGTDVNPRFLQQAREGVYTHWSFRDVPAGIFARHFAPEADGRLAVLPHLGRMVTFAPHNLVGGTGPLALGPVPCVDLILCRNVLMYMTAEQARQAAGLLGGALGMGGWLLVGGAEVSPALFAPLVPVSFPGAVLYRRRGGQETGPDWAAPPAAPEMAEGGAGGPEAARQRWEETRGPGQDGGGQRVIHAPWSAVPRYPVGATAGAEAPGPARETPAAHDAGGDPAPAAGAAARAGVPLAAGPAGTSGDPCAVPRALHAQGRHREAEEALVALLSAGRRQAEGMALLARVLADQGRLVEALVWCERAVAADPLQPGSHYLLAVILQEQERLEEAAAALHRALYVDPDFALAHVALAQLRRRQDRRGEAALEGGSGISPEERDRILRARARALARQPAREGAPQDALQVIEFLLAQETYALELAYVREVYPLRDLAVLPCTPPFVLGIASVRGQVLPVLDLKKLFELPDRGLADFNKLIVLAGDGLEFGILADVVVGVRSLPLGEVRQTAQVASDKARHVSESAQKSVQVAQSGRQAVEESISGMGRIREQMGAIAETIVRLSEQSQAIGEIIATVNDLADQSNLLAVNAAIEAAKAGEQGRGFAVVAQEVKSLAEQSKQATAQVRAILGEVQKATSAAVMATEQGSKAVEAGVRQSTQAGQSIKTLADSTAEAAQAATQIAASSQQQQVGMEQVAVAMESIKQASAQNVASTHQAEAAAQNLHELGQKLRQLVEQYRN
ncbi:MAG: CheR family methyltransferase [Candidatus Latescibacterota bacterium]